MIVQESNFLYDYIYPNDGSGQTRGTDTYILFRRKQAQTEVLLSGHDIIYIDNICNKLLSRGDGWDYYFVHCDHLHDGFLSSDKDMLDLLKLKEI